MDDNPFRRRLLTGERLVWIGAPGRGVIFKGQDLFVVPFSLFWCGFAVFWTWEASQSDGRFGLFGLPFIAIGLFMLVGRFVLDIWLRRRTAYAVTDRRILIQRDPPFGAFVSRDLVGLPEIFLCDEKGTRGTLRFGSAPASARDGFTRIGIPALDDVPQFIAIDGVDDVLRIVLEAAGAARAAGSR